MFVRLFVDENLDRHVPISRQPKEKIQAIIDSCTRQFPEYAARARKRIRTYLKSCRRTKRTREQAGIDMANVSSNHKESSSLLPLLRYFQMNPSFEGVQHLAWILCSRSAWISEVHATYV